MIIPLVLIYAVAARAETEKGELVSNKARLEAHASKLQDLINQAKEGEVIVPPPGTYSGPVVINKGITIDGRGRVTITGDGQRHGLVIYGSDVVVRNIHITNTGHSTEVEESCVLIEQGSRNTIENVTMDECFFGIDFKKTNKNIIRRNSVRGKSIDLGMRGDGLRLWYSSDNELSDNHVERFKDQVVWYSNGNRLIHNYVTDCRYSVHFMFAADNIVEGNFFIGNAVGVYVMYTGKIKILDNYIANSYGPTGMAVGFKEASDVVVERNDILYCAEGVGIDLSPFEPDSSVRLAYNRFSYNSVAIKLNSKLSGIQVVSNVFEGNLDDVAVAMNETAAQNMFNNNYWDTYAGFDRDHDGYADTPYSRYAYVDQIWMDIPMARFFKNSATMEFLDFLEQLAPFSSPTLIFKDAKPVMDKDLLLKGRKTIREALRG